MAVISAAFSSKHRRPKAFALRSFPPLCGQKLPPAPGILANDRNVAPINLTGIPPEPAPCGPKNDHPSVRETIKPPVVFAVRKFPKGCGRPKKASAVVAGGIAEKGDGLHKVVEAAVVGGSVGNDDVRNPSRKSSQIPDLAEGNIRGPEGSESKNEVKEMEAKLNDIVMTITEDASDLGKSLKNAAIGSSLGENDVEENDDQEPIKKSSNSFVMPESFESKKELNDTRRRISNRRSGSGKNVESTVIGRSLDEKDGKKTNKKRPLMSDLVEGGRSQSGQVVDLRGGRLVVQALMAAARCPWMQGKNKASIALQFKQKKPRVKENDNSAKK